MKTYSYIGLTGKTATTVFEQDEICLPILQDCSLPDPEQLISVCNSVDNCRVVDSTDTLHIQTLFADDTNPDPQNPVSGIGGGVITVELFDITDSLISNTIDDFTSDHTVGFYQGQTYQIIAVDLSEVNTLTGGDEFYFTFTGPGGSISTQCFSFDCSESYVWRSDWNTRDCFGYYYGDADIPFDNSMRLEGAVIDDGGTLTKELISTVVANREVIENYRFRSKPISTAQRNKFFKQIIAGDRVFLDGVEVRIDSATVTNLFEETSNQFAFEIPFSLVCTGNANC